MGSAAFRRPVQQQCGDECRDCTPPPFLSPVTLSNSRSDGQAYAMKKISIASMEKREIQDTLNEIR